MYPGCHVRASPSAKAVVRQTAERNRTADLAGMPSQALATRQASAHNAVVPATRRPNVKGLVVVLAKPLPPAESVAEAECHVKQHNLAENGPTTPLSSTLTPSSTPSPTSVTASPQPHWLAQSNASSNASPSRARALLATGKGAPSQSGSRPHPYSRRAPLPWNTGSAFDCTTCWRSLRSLCQQDRYLYRLLHRTRSRRLR